MIRTTVTAALLCGSVVAYSAPAKAQDGPAPGLAEPGEPDASDATADAQIMQGSALEDAQAKLAMLQAQVEALQTSIEAIRKQDIKETPSWKSVEWASGTTIGGKAFLNVSSINQKTDGQDTSQNGTQAELKRFYLGVDHKFSDMFSVNLTTDFRYGANGTSKDVLVYVKKAYLQAKFAPELVLRVGAADLPWVPFVEDLYGYRYIENVVIDRTKFGTSSDWGVHLAGSMKDGLLSYAVSAVNGAGYKTLSRGSNTIDLEGRISLRPVKEIVLGIGGYSGKLGKSADNLPESATPHRARRLNAVAAYVGPRARFGIEYFKAKNWNNVTTVTSDKSDGWSAFGAFAFNPRFSVFGRYDWVRPNLRSNDDLKDQYFNIALGYAPIKNIDLALVYKRDKAVDGTISTSNGTIGGFDEGTYDEFGIWSQVKF